jgi:hypothetical protein
MRFRTLGCVLLGAALLTFSATAVAAADGTASRLKFGASGQVYVWQAGSC